MTSSLIKKTKELEVKQQIILDLASKISLDKINLKIHSELSPIGWHIIHCLFIEVIWIRSKLLNDCYYENKLKKIADATKLPLNKRHIGLPNAKKIISFSKKLFSSNIILLLEIFNNKNITKSNLSYLIDFLNSHHSQHIENIKNILNLINIKYNKKRLSVDSHINPAVYKFKGLNINDGYYLIGPNKKKFFYDNETPNHRAHLNSFKISNNLITIPEWLGFIDEGGYKKKYLWTKEGWNWKIKNQISHPLNWIFIDKKRFLISTYKGFDKVKKNMPVSNISKFELEAFANYYECRLPHEFEWEASYKKIKNKYKVWEWSSNQFFGYKGFKPYPYKEYSLPWFKNNYFTLKGGSVYSLKEIKRASFRNFYKPSARYILSGGRLCI